MVKLVDTQVLGTCAARLGGSSPLPGTSSRNSLVRALTLLYFAVYDEYMKRWSAIVVFISLFLLSGCTKAAYATSSLAYKDYLFQYDRYRQAYSEFKVAKNEYEKFKSLASQTTALDKTKIMLAQRDQLLRAYLFLLNEKLNEDQGLTASERQLYQTLIRNEVTFLEGHALLIPSVGSLTDAVTVSKQLESHYQILQTTERQIIVGIALGKLAELAKQYDATTGLAQIVLATYGNTFTPQKQATLNRWVLQITNKRSLYQQKVDAISQGSAQMKATDTQTLDRKFAELMKNAAEARQYLAEGSSFLGELVNTLRFID